MIMNGNGTVVLFVSELWLQSIFYLLIRGNMNFLGQVRTAGTRYWYVSTM